MEAAGQQRGLCRRGAMEQGAGRGWEVLDEQDGVNWVKGRPEKRFKFAQDAKAFWQLRWVWSVPETTAGEGSTTIQVGHIRLFDVEGQSRDWLCKTHKFPPAHLDLKRTFFDTRLNGVGCETLSWVSEAEHWRRSVEENDAMENARECWHLKWIKSFAATCSNAADPRHLLVTPSERFQCEIEFSHRTTSTCFCQLQLTIDLQKPVVNVDQVCGGHHHGKKQFELVAPVKPGVSAT